MSHTCSVLTNMDPVGPDTGDEVADRRRREKFELRKDPNAPPGLSILHVDEEEGEYNKCDCLKKNLQ